MTAPKSAEQLSRDVIALAKGVADQGDALLRSNGESMVLTACLAALVATHPNPAEFASSFRRFWMLLGQQHSNPEHDAQTQAGIDDMLGILEEACAARLLVRPDRP